MADIYLKNFYIRLLFGFLKKGRGVILLPILVKGLGTNSYGVFTQVTLTVTVLTHFVTVGLRETCVRFISGETDKKAVARTYLTILLILMLSLSVVSILFLFFKKQASFVIFSDTRYAVYVYLIIMLLALRALNGVALSFFRAHNRAFLFSVIDSSKLVFELMGIFVIWIYFDFTIYNVIAAFIAVELVMAVAAHIPIARMSGFAAPDLKLAGPFIKFGFPLIIGDSLFQFVDLSDRYFIAHYLGIDYSGIYNASYNITKLTNLLVPAVLFSLYPLITKYWEEKNYTRLDHQIGQALKLHSFIILPACFGLFKIYPALITKLTSNDFLLDRYTLACLLGSFLIVGFSYIFHFVIYASKKTFIFGIILGFVALTNITLNFLLIPKIGLLGAAVSTIISYGLYVTLLLMISRRVFRWQWPLAFMGKAFFASLLMYMILYGLPCDDPAWLLVNIFAGAVSYLLLWVLLSVLSGKNPFSIIANVLPNHK